MINVFMFSLFTYLLSIDSRIEVVIVSSSLLVSVSLFTYIVSIVSRNEIVKDTRYRHIVKTKNGKAKCLGGLGLAFEFCRRGRGGEGRGLHFTPKFII